MDHVSNPPSGDHADEMRNYPAQGPKYGQAGSPLVDPQNLPSCSHEPSQNYSATFADGGQSGVNGDNSHPAPEGTFAFANGPDVCKTCVPPTSGAPGPM